MAANVEKYFQVHEFSLPTLVSSKQLFCVSVGLFSFLKKSMLKKFHTHGYKRKLIVRSSTLEHNHSADCVTRQKSISYLLMYDYIAQLTNQNEML